MFMLPSSGSMPGVAVHGRRRTLTGKSSCSSEALQLDHQVEHLVDGPFGIGCWGGRSC